MVPYPLAGIQYICRSRKGSQNFMKKLLWILFYLFLFALLIANSFSYLDPDFGWHLRFGEIIWQTKNIPHDQIFMWTLAGKNWVDHEWLGNLLLYGLWSAGGYGLVTVFFAALPLLAIIIANRFIFARKAFTAEGMFLVAFLEAAAFFAMRGHLGVRLQEFTFLFLVLLLILIQKTRSEARSRALWWIIPLVYAWACLHGGFLIAFAVVGGWLIYEWAIHIKPAYWARFGAQPLATRRLLQYNGIALIAFLVSGATPYGLELYSFLGGYRDTYYMSYIREWLSPLTYPVNYAQLVANIGVAGLAVWALMQRRANSLLAFLSAAAFLLLAFRSMRHFPLLVATTIIFIFPIALPSLAPSLTALVRRRISWLTAACLFACSVALFFSAHFTTQPFNSYCNSYPCQASRFLDAHPEYLQGRLLNNYNYGGFLIGTRPQWRLFIDGRLPQYAYAGKTILEEYNRFNSAEQTEQQLNTHNISTVLLRKYSQPPSPDWFEIWVLGYRPALFEKDRSALQMHLDTATDWKKVYEDSDSCIYVRR